MALDFFAGCLGGCAGIMVGYPLDTIKVHMQTQDYRNPKYRGTWHCFRTILAQESVLGLYRGMTSPMAGVAVVNAIVFGVYGQTQRNLSDPEQLSAHFLAGMSAGIAQSPVCSPIELAKTRLQLQSGSCEKYSGPIQCLRAIYKCEGYRGVFRGLGITLLREAPSYGTYFLAYEWLTRTSSHEPISISRILVAGGLAGTASWVISYPIDFVKSRLQAEERGRYAGALDCLRQSVRAEGYLCLYRGLNSTILRAFPTNAATFAVVSWTFGVFGSSTKEVAKVEELGPTVIQPKTRSANVYGNFVEGWQGILHGASNGYMFSRSYYSTMTVSSMDASIFRSFAVCADEEGKNSTPQDDAGRRVKMVEDYQPPEKTVGKLDELQDEEQEDDVELEEDTEEKRVMNITILGVT